MHKANALLFAVVALPLAMGATCSKRGSDAERGKASIHYDLGIQAMQSGDPRGALAEYLKAVEIDPDFALAHNALGLTYHLSFDKPDLAIEHYRKALEKNPKYTEVQINLGNVYLSTDRCPQAIPYYEKALADLLYRTPEIPENNLGWCLHKLGKSDEGIAHIRRAVAANGRFCLGYRNLALIYTERNDRANALQSYALFARNCPEIAEARYQYGKAALGTGDTDLAQREFEACLEKSSDEALSRACDKALNELDAP